jgi:hypothetical protein
MSRSKKRTKHHDPLETCKEVYAVLWDWLKSEDAESPVERATRLLDLLGKTIEEGVK